MEDELNASIGELRLKYAALQGKFAKLESDKLVCLSHFYVSTPKFVSVIIIELAHDVACRMQSRVTKEKWN